MKVGKFLLQKSIISMLVCGATSFAYADGPSYFIKSTQAIKGFGGVVTRHDGKLLLAASPKVIRIFNPFNGQFESIAYQLPDVNSLPDDLAIIPRDDNKSIIGGFSVASFLDGRIPTVQNDGTVIQSNPPGTFFPVTETGVYNAMYSQQLLGLNPIAYRKSDDRLYVASAFDGDHLFKLDWRGEVPTPINLTPQAPRSLNAFQFGPDDKLYAPDTPNGVIDQIDVDTGVVTPILSNLNSPIAVKVDSHGIIFFLERKTGKVYRYNKLTNTKQLLATLEPALDNLSLNNAETKLYVTNDENKIYEVDANSGHSRILFQSPVGQIWDLAYDFDTNSVFVADFASIKRFNATNAHLDDIIRFGALNSGLSDLGSQASSLTVEPGEDGKIIVTDITLGNIIVLNKNFTPYDITLTSDKTQLAFKQPLSAVRVKTNSSEYYLATDTVEGKIVKIRHNGVIDPNNIMVADFFVGLRSPVKLKLYKGYVYVVEMGQITQGVPNSGRISRISLANPQNRQILQDHLNDPQGLDIFNGKMYFVESGVGSKRLLRASAAHPGQYEVLKENLDLQQDIIISQFNPIAKVNPPTGVAIGKKGKRWYVNETGPDAIRQINNSLTD